jgi:peptide/nickel transport system ATP-binding protein/oligopeptide transport system ATP-binding protein
METALSVRDLQTYFHTDDGDALAVDGVSFDIPAGKTMALVGESGCGKSVTALSIMRLIQQPPGRIAGGSVMLGDRDILRMSPEEMRNVRGNSISMIFQEPMTSLNPVFRVGDQIAAAIRLHTGVSKQEARKKATDLLEKVGIPSPGERIDDYPHQMSGGMRQRVMIAMALACNPTLLIADEPTTALDVTIQAQILELLKELQAREGMAILLITHDLGIVAEAADFAAIMYAGKIVEQAPVPELFANPKHPYTIGLFSSIPKLDDDRDRLQTIQGQVPAATHFPAGCRFHPRCPKRMDACEASAPETISVGADHTTACKLYDKEKLFR